MNVRFAGSALALFSVALLGACATAPPSQELQDARAAYHDAKSNEAAHMRPEALVDARQTLEAAEAAHEDDPGSAEERHLASLAQLRAQLAVARGEQTKFDRERKAKQDQLVANAKRAASSAKQQLRSTSDEMAKTKQELAEERKRRQQAQQLADAALEDLKRVAMVKEEARGTVITLSGAVLFKSGESDLLHTARAKLSEVAKALTDEGRDGRVVVEGHTDSQGSDSYNQQLALARAQSVREYLVSQGMDASRLEAKGVGEQQPIASNATPEGRANNRRVEIIVKPEQPQPQPAASAMR